MRFENNHANSKKSSWTLLTIVRLQLEKNTVGVSGFRTWVYIYIYTIIDITSVVRVQWNRHSKRPIKIVMEIARVVRRVARTKIIGENCAQSFVTISKTHDFSIYTKTLERDECDRRILRSVCRRHFVFRLCATKRTAEYKPIFACKTLRTRVYTVVRGVLFDSQLKCRDVYG